MKNFGINEKSYNMLIDFFKQHDEVEIVKIWGSRMDGTFHSSSDIDLFVKFVNTGDIDYLKKYINLLPVPYRIELRDIDSDKIDTLMKYVYKEGYIFYEKNNT